MIEVVVYMAEDSRHERHCIELRVASREDADKLRDLLDQTDRNGWLHISRAEDLN